MKKLIVLLLALLVATSAFAQLTINGYSRGTAYYQPTAVNGTIPGASMLYRLRMNYSYNDPNGTFGAWGRLQSDSFASPALLYGYAWANFFNKTVKLNAGLLANYDYMVGSGLSDYKLGNICTDAYIGDATKGVLAQFMPTPALNVGVTYLPDGANLSGADFTASAKYSIDKVGNVLVNVRPGDGTASVAYNALTGHIGTDFFASGAFEFTGVAGLDATVAFEYGGTGFWHGYVANQMTLVANVTYAQGPFKVQVAPVYNLTGSSLYVEGGAQYKVTKDLTLRVIGAYDQTGSACLGSATKPSTYYAGFEVAQAVGNGYVMTGVWYDDYNKINVPVGLKVVF
jgi:hypothetical protein